MVNVVSELILKLGSGHQQVGTGKGRTGTGQGRAGTGQVLTDFFDEKLW